MDTTKKLTLIQQDGLNSLFKYRHLYIRHEGTTANPNQYAVLMTDKETVMHRSTMKGCKRFITHRKQDLDTLADEHGFQPTISQ